MQVSTELRSAVVTPVQIARALNPTGEHEEHEDRLLLVLSGFALGSRGTRRWLQQLLQHRNVGCVNRK